MDSNGYISAGKDVATAAIALAKNNPTIATTVALGTTGLAIVAAPGVAVALIVTFLHYVGFGAGGVVGGTAAASAQASIGNVVAPGLFATLTSAGAGGYGVATISGAVQLFGGTMAGLASAAGTWMTARA